MKTIWKFPLDTFPVQYVDMPEGAEILTVQVQNGTPMLWAEVDSKARFRPRLIYVIGTGMELDSGVSRYIGTFQWEDEELGDFVGHVYE